MQSIKRGRIITDDKPSCERVDPKLSCFSRKTGQLAITQITQLLVKSDYNSCTFSNYPPCDGLREHFPRTDNCGKLDRWQRLTELMCSAKRSFKRKSSSAGMLSSQSVCRVRYLVATVLMKCTATDPPVLRTT